MNSVIPDSIGQAAIGLAVGGTLDALFPAPKAVDDSTILLTTVEAAAQIAGGALAIATSLDMAIQRQWLGQSDPFKGVALTFGFINGQPNLRQKLTGMSMWLKSKLTSLTFTGGSSMGFKAAPMLPGLDAPQSAVAPPQHVETSQMLEGFDDMPDGN